MPKMIFAMPKMSLAMLKVSFAMPKTSSAVLWQELSTMIRVHTNPIIFLLDNAEYVIEEQIHPGPYNKLQDWDYCALAQAMKGKSDNLFTVKVRASSLQASHPVSEGSGLPPFA